MKKNLFFAALAITALVSCSESEYVGDEKQVPVSNDVGAINFGTGFKAVTRAVEGKAAADSLNYNFVVEGTKSVTANSSTTVSEVFDNYNVNWVENTADKTLSNTANWEYVGQALNDNTAVHEQSIKYWDFAASQYDFWAYSLGGGSATVTALGPDNSNFTTGAYTITGSKTDLAKVYISDLVTTYNPNENVSNEPVMGDEVVLSFRSLVTKVRVGLYETIPGYSVREVKFYPASDGEPTTTATLYASDNVLPAFKNNQATYTVTFPTTSKSNVTNSDYNKAHVAINSSESGTASKVEFGTLAYGPHQDGKYEKTGYSDNPSESWTDIWVQRSTNTCTWAKEANAAAGAYSIVLPNETGAVLTLKVDYILESIDGTGETITVHGATALVPSQYTQWKPNYAYTYIFKISDNTNGLTNTNVDKVGLYPITLNAVVVDTEEFTQETITTVATPSITTYSISSDVTHNNEYVVGDSIYVTATTDGTLLNMNDKAVLYHIEKLNTSGNYVDYAATEAEVLDALTTYTSYNSTDGVYVGRDSIRLTPVSNALDLTVTEIPLADGNTITKKNDTDNLSAGDVAKIQKNKMGAGKYYAFVYTHDDGDAATPTYLPVYVAAGGDVTGLVSTNNGSDAAATTNANEAQTLYAKYFTVKNAVYGIKVIKIAN